MRLQAKVALITGTASGIGRAAALRFSREGAKVAALDVSVVANEETVKLVRDAGGDAIALPCDVSKESDVAEAFEAAEATFGKVDIAFNNAGIMLADDGDSQSTSDETLERTLDVNLKGVLYGCKYAVAAMR